MTGEIPSLRLDRWLGQGAMGQVYLANISGKSVALKVLTALAPMALASFAEEALHLSRLKHPGLAELKGFLKNFSGDKDIVAGPCLWMEYIEGRPLHEASPEATPAQRVAWLRQCLETLDYLHRQGVLHGDIKPANLLVDAKNKVRLIDFGLATLMERAVTATGPKLQGALPYLAPEALQGERGAPSDLYSLGLVFYEAIAGRPARGEIRSVLDLFSPDYPRLSSFSKALPHRVLRVIDRLMEPDPARRWGTAREALQALASDRPAESRPAATAFIPYRLLGRDREFQAYLAFLERFQKERSGAVVLVRGLTGVGKSRLLREISWDLRIKGVEMVSLTAAKEIYRFLQGDHPNSICLVEWNEDQSSGQEKDFFETLLKNPQVLCLQLGDLTVEQSREFLSLGLGREVPIELAQVVLEKTHGNPRLLTELVREILDRGLNTKKIFSVKQLSGINLKKNLSKVFASRWSSLSARHQSLLEALALTTGVVTEAKLSQVLTRPRGELREACAELIARGLLRYSSRGDGSLEIAMPGFKNMIVEGILLVARRKLHQRWLEVWERGSAAVGADLSLSRFGGMSAPVEILAHHVLALPEHPRHWEWILAAADQLEERGAWEKAAALYQQALARKAEALRRDEILRRLTNAFGAMGHFKEVLRVSELWFQEFSQDPQGLNPVKYWLTTAVAYKNLGDFPEAKRRLETCLQAADPQNPEHRRRRARATILLGQLALREKNYTEAKARFDAAQDFLAADSAERAELFLNEAQLAGAQGLWDEALKIFSAAAELYHNVASTHGLFSVALEKGSQALHLEKIPEAEVAYGEALSIAAQAGDEALLARAYQNLGVLARHQGDLAKTLDELEKARELFLIFGSPEEIALNHLELSRTHAQCGNFSTAREFFKKAKIADAYLSVKNLAEEIQNEIKTIQSGTKNSKQNDAEAREKLQTIYERLPLVLKHSFEERPDFKRLLKTPTPQTLVHEEAEMKALEQLSQITTDLLRLVDGGAAVLNRIMEAAMGLSKAKRGFLLVRSAETTGPIPGFSLVVEKNLGKEFLSGDHFRMSLSAIQGVMGSGELLVTDNAVLDQRFRSAASVQEFELKSILILPLKTGNGMLGVIYLDHPFATDIFRGADLNVLEIFAGQAALALEKAQWVASLKEKNQNLNATVENQTSELTWLKREVEQQNLKLKYEYAEIIGQSKPMQSVLQLLDRLVDASLPVWVFGESGTGKEMVARALHFKGPRSNGPFVSENCSSLPETLLESELFGHKKGAFTHADRDKKGLLQMADGGTIFLDEIADMSPAMQAKLLRFLQEGEIRPVGSNEVIKVDARVVSASNQDLHELVKKGKFRRDLFYRLNGMTLTLPPLRDRVEDIPLLVKHFLEKIAKAEPHEPYVISPEALQLLVDYPWPGNVRELENALRSACIFHYQGKIVPNSFHFKKDLMGAKPGGKAGRRKGTGPMSAETLDERVLLLKALKTCGYHKGEAAKHLGISRRYLYTQMDKFQIPLKRVPMKVYVERALQ